MNGLNKKKHYISVVAASYILVAIASVIKAQLSNSALEPISFFIGAGFSMSVIPLLTMRFHSSYAGWIVFVLLGFLYSVGVFDSIDNEKTASTSTPRIHQAKNCEFSVTFPSTPEVKVYTHPQLGDYEEALWVSTVPEDSTILRTECIPVQLNLDTSNAKDFLLDQLAILAKNNGLSSVEYLYKFEAIGPTGYIRGIKYIQEKPITYRVATVAGKSSLITLYAGGLSSTFPQREVNPFIASVKKVN